MNDKINNKLIYKIFNIQQSAEFVTISYNVAKNRLFICFMIDKETIIYYYNTPIFKNLYSEYLSFLDNKYFIAFGILYFLCFFINKDKKHKFYKKIPKALIRIKNIFILGIFFILVLRYFRFFMSYYIIYFYTASLITLIYCLIQYIRVKITKTYIFDIGYLIYRFNVDIAIFFERYSENNGDSLFLDIISGIIFNISFFLTIPSSITAKFFFNQGKTEFNLYEIFLKMVFRLIFGVPFYLLKSMYNCKLFIKVAKYNIIYIIF